MPHGLEGFVKLAPAVWPGEPLDVQPGDLSKFVPMGNGLGAPMVVRPWDNLEDLSSRGQYYGFHPHTGHPFTGAPITEAGGGVIYFDAYCQPPDIEAALRLMEVAGDLKQYAMFVEDSEKQGAGYLTQMRIVSGGAMQFLFRAAEGGDFNALTQQTMTVRELILKLVDHFKIACNGDDYPIEGTMGGDDDWAKESLAFGFMVENQYHAVYRLWTRAWLVTK